MANPSEPLAMGYNYDDTHSISIFPSKTIRNANTNVETMLDSNAKR